MVGGVGAVGEVGVSRGLLVGTHAEAVDFLLGEVAPVATAEVLLGESGELYAVELGDAVAEGLEDATHDAVLTGVDLDADLLLVNGIGILDIVGMDFTILELNALCYLRQVVGSNGLVEVDVVDLLLEELRMSELGCQVTVVGQQKDARGVTVETPHRIDALRTSILDEIHDRLALLRVIGRGDVVLGLIEQDVDLLLLSNGLVVETDFVGTENLGTQFGDDIAIDGNDTSLDELVGLAT